MPHPDASDLEAFVLHLAAEAATAILPLFRADHGLEDKGTGKGANGFDPVTLADRNAEAAIRRAIQARFPDHGVIGEEYGEDRPDAEHVWVLDPIDGTRAFISGLPVWTTLIALRHEGRPILGAIAQPFLAEVFVGSAEGSRLVTPTGERPLRVRPCRGLDQALIATTDDNLFRGDDTAPWRRVHARARLVRYGCDAYAYAMVALGAMDAVVECGLKAWDIEAAIPVLHGAGGFVTHWDGSDIGSHGGSMLIAGDRRVRDEAIALLAGAADAP